MAAEICQFHLENRCRFGDQCWNLHPHPPEADPEVETAAEEQCDVIQQNPPIRRKVNLNYLINYFIFNEIFCELSLT